MARPCAYNWETIRAEYEAGLSIGELSRNYGPTKPTISSRAKKEGWIRDVSGTVNRLAEAKANGLSNGFSNGVSIEAKAEAMAKAIDLKAEVLVFQRTPWVPLLTALYEAAMAGDEAKVKLLKTAIEGLRSGQDAQRRAWGINEVVEAKVSGNAQVEVFEYPDDGRD